MTTPSTANTGRFAWAQELPRRSYPPFDPTSTIIDRAELQNVLADIAPEVTQSIVDDLDFLEENLVPLFRSRHYEARRELNRYRFNQLIISVVALTMILMSVLQLVALVSAYLVEGSFANQGECARLQGSRNLVASLRDLGVIEATEDIESLQSLSVQREPEAEGAPIDSVAVGAAVADLIAIQSSNCDLIQGVVNFLMIMAVVTPGDTGDGRQAVSVIQPDAAFDLLSIFHDGIMHGGVTACMTGDELRIRQGCATGEQVGEQRAAGIMRPEVARSQAHTPDRLGRNRRIRPDGFACLRHRDEHVFVVRAERADAPLLQHRNRFGASKRDGARFIAFAVPHRQQASLKVNIRPLQRRCLRPAQTGVEQHRQQRAIAQAQGVGLRPVGKGLEYLIGRQRPALAGLTGPVV
jgi:hypothetical protein